MSKLRTLALLPFVLALTFAVRPAHATDDPPPAAPAAVAAAQDDDDATLQLAEPDFRLINQPTTMRLPLFKGNFDLTHRFAGNLRQGDFDDQLARLFGIDEGATIGFEYRFGLAPHLELAAYRTSAARTIQIYAKYDALHQRASMPFSASLVASVEGTNNLQQDYAPSLAASLSYMVGDVLALYAVPTWVHNSAAAIGIDRDTGDVGLGGRLRIRPTVYIAVEASPRFSGYSPGTTQYGFALEKRAGGHMFQLNFTNSAGTTPAQIARGGQPDNLGLGFNLSRKFF